MARRKMGESIALRSKTNSSPKPVAIATSSKAFFDLPAEIRNMIYELALEDQKTIKYLVSSPKGMNTRVKGPPLLLASKQIHQEAIGIFYSTASFHFEIPQKMLTWLRKLGAKKRGLLREVIVDDEINLELDHAIPAYQDKSADKDKLAEVAVSKHLRAFERRMGDSGLALKAGCIELRMKVDLYRSTSICCFMSIRDVETGEDQLGERLTWWTPFWFRQ